MIFSGFSNISRCASLSQRQGYCRRALPHSSSIEVHLFAIVDRSVRKLFIEGSYEVVITCEDYHPSRKKLQANTVRTLTRSRDTCSGSHGPNAATTNSTAATSPPYWRISSSSLPSTTLLLVAAPAEVTQRSEPFPMGAETVGRGRK